MESTWSHVHDCKSTLSPWNQDRWCARICSSDIPSHWLLQCINFHFLMKGRYHHKRRIRLTSTEQRRLTLHLEEYTERNLQENWSPASNSEWHDIVPTGSAHCMHGSGGNPCRKLRARSRHRRREGVMSHLGVIWWWRNWNNWPEQFLILHCHNPAFRRLWQTRGLTGRKFGTVIFSMDAWSWGLQGVSSLASLLTWHLSNRGESLPEAKTLPWSKKRPEAFSVVVKVHYQPLMAEKY